MNRYKRRQLMKYSVAASGASVMGFTGCSAGDSAGGGQSDDVNDSEAWLSGGTDLISVAFPEDAIFDSGEACSLALIPPTTVGPCFFDDDTGEDISEGFTGLPMQLCLQLVDVNCQPLAGYTVDVWHCDTQGRYSGDTSESADAGGFASSFCTADDTQALQSTWYRGKLTSNSQGRVNFKTCFPGWYPGRTIHIHFLISDSSGSAQFASQFCFSDQLASDICTSHELYRNRGEQDATLASGSDAVFPSDGYEAFLLTTQQNPDGSLLAYRRVQIV